MSLKKQLDKEIRKVEEEIDYLERKRTRSQAAIVESLIAHTEPDETDAQYFRLYTAEINEKRRRLIELKKQLNNL